MIYRWYLDLIHLLFPPLCLCCNLPLVRQEAGICLGCLQEIPRTHLHSIRSNKIEEIFWGRAVIQQASSWYYYSPKGKFHPLIIAFKYQHNPQLARHLGKWAALEMRESPDYETPDLIIPIPLHPQRWKKRGYNQSLEIAKGISEVWDIPIDSLTLIRVVNNPTQTEVKDGNKWDNVASIFAISEQQTIESQHILLVDDILTSGSTLLAAANTLQHYYPKIRISIFTIGYTVNNQ